MTTSNSFKRNIPILAFCQALFMSGTSLMVATTALVGYALADDKIYASLPFTLQLLAIPAVISIIISLVWLYKIDKITHVQPNSEMID